AWFVVENYRVAKCKGEWAVAAGVGDAGEGGAAVRGARYAREVARVGASRIVEGDANLVGVVWVRCSECLRLCSVGERLGAGDQVDVPGTICQGCQGGWQQLLDKPGEGARSGRRTSASLAAVKHDESPFKALHLVDAQLVNLGTVKARRQDADVDGLGLGVILLWHFCRFRSGRPGRASAAP